MSDINQQIKDKKTEITDCELFYVMEKEKQARWGTTISHHEPHATQIYVRIGEADDPTRVVIWIPKKDIPDYNKGSVSAGLQKRIDAEAAKQYADRLEHCEQRTMDKQRELVDLNDERSEGRL